MKYILQFIKERKNIFFTIGLIEVIVHITFFQSINSLSLVPVLVYWMFLGIFYKWEEKIFFGMSVILLVISLPFFLFDNFEITERLFVWAFLFIILGLIQWMFLEISSLKTKK